MLQLNSDELNIDIGQSFRQLSDMRSWETSLELRSVRPHIAKLNFA